MARSYSKYLLTIIIAGITATIFINWLVNPYNLFSAVDIAGFNTVKTEADKLQRLNKAYEIKRIRPDAIIIGTSRALYLAPSHPALKNFNSYNLALTSASSYEILRYVQHAHTNNPLKEIIYGIDFISFNEKRQLNYADDRLNADTLGRYRSQSVSSYVGDILPNLLSLDALRASLKTIKKQGELSANSYSSKSNKVKRVKNRGGHRRMFLREEQNALVNGALNYPDCLDSTPGLNFSPPIYDHFRTLLRTAYKNDIILRMFISPTHARYNEVLCAQGQWTVFEEWKKNIVAINEEEGRLANRPAFKLWDFGGYNFFTTEEVPTLDDDKTLMKWYWEGTHYSQEMGDLILNRLFSKKDGFSENFGLSLTSPNMGGHLSRIRQSRRHYVETHRGEINEINQIVKNLQSRQK